MENYEKLSTIQKREKLNTVYRVGEKGPGGAYHDYEIWADAKQDYYPLLKVQHQKGPRGDLESRKGIVDQDLLEIVRDRLICFCDGNMPTYETEMALQNVECALMWLNKRTEDRIERNVLGTYNK